MRRLRYSAALLLLLMTGLTAGCRSPYRSDQGALMGGLTGAGVGAVIGNQFGNPGGGAALGAGVGALTGAAVGQGLDDVAAANRAEIEARLGRPTAAGAVRLDEVIAMSQAGVAEETIARHVQLHGVAAPPTSADLITLKNAGVSDRVTAALLEPPPRVPATVVGPQPVIVEQHHYGPRLWGHGHHHGHRRRGGPHWRWGFSAGAH